MYPIVRDAYTPSDSENGAGVDFCVVDPKSGKRVKQVSLAKQEFKDECDINVIMRKYENGGTLPQLRASDPMYGDFSTAEDYHEAVNRVMTAQDQFMALDAKVRSRFDNDPAKLLAYVENPDESVLSKADAKKYGIFNPDPVEAPIQKVEVVNQEVEGTK